MQLRLTGTLFACACALVSVPVAAQGSYSRYDESPTAALARYVRTLASEPKDFETLIGAGRAALALGDTQAAAGFFARADDVDPRSPLPQAGMGAVAVANGEPQAALPYFKRAQQLGARPTDFACDRGLAYDLMGQQAQAQADYRAAMSGPDSDEARKRLALSLAISGDRSNAIQTLAPLSARGEAGVARIRAFVLALTGDPNAALNAVNAAMPGSGANVAPFLQRLPGLTAGQKAAAVNLGIFPDGGAPAYAYSAPPRATMTPVANGDRLGGIDAMLNAAPTTAQPAAPAPAVQVAYAQPPRPAVVQRSVARFQPRIWLQLASDSNVDNLTGQFQRLKSHNPDLFSGIKPYVSRSADRARLLVGPFRGTSDAEIFADDLKSAGIDAYRFTNSQTDRIAPLAAE
ncbi:MAG: tetratricopeptide repeat protein [Sphingomicrobium sp.]